MGGTRRRRSALAFLSSLLSPPKPRYVICTNVGGNWADPVDKDDQLKSQMTILKPTDKFCDTIDGVLVIGFKEADRYFIIQKESQTDKAELYIELDDQRYSCYNGLRDIITGDNKLTFELNTQGRKNLQTDIVVISCELSDKLTTELEIIKKELVDQPIT